jgi:hypothetical protein
MKITGRKANDDVAYPQRCHAWTCCQVFSGKNSNGCLEQNLLTTELSKVFHDLVFTVALGNVTNKEPCVGD